MKLYVFGFISCATIGLQRIYVLWLERHTFNAKSILALKSSHATEINWDWDEVLFTGYYT